jgi:hypothetical protein
MSAAATSPSDYASPGFFTQGQESQGLPAASYNSTPFQVPYLSPNPMAENAAMVPPSVSPLSFMSPGEPTIVDQSPPLSMMHRSASADIYSLSHDHKSTISEDGTGLNEMYSKHTLNLPMHPHSPAYVEQSAADMDMNQLVSFDEPPASMSPESIPQ